MRRALIIMLALAACKGEGAPNPAPMEDAPTTTTTSGGGEGKPPDPAVRTVEMRNPLGQAVGNLLVDGDFELSVTFEGRSQQLGWFIFSNSQAYLRLKTGGICRSGLRCGLLPSGHIAFGRGTSAKGTGMVASVWAKPPPGNACDSIQPLAIRCSFSSQLTQSLKSAASAPDGDGWCFYRGRLDPVDEPMCLYIQADDFEGEGEAILDDARMIPDDGTAPLAAPITPSASERSRMRAIADYLRRRTPIGSPPRFQPPTGR